MNYLLDTHILVWLLTAPNRLTARTIAAIADPAANIFVSPVSFYEIEYERQLGKWDIGPIDDWPDQIIEDGLHILSIRPEDMLYAAQLPRHHKDPWDRILIANANFAGLILVTQDSDIQKYNVKTLS